MGGWGIVAADIIVMANLAQIAGVYGFRLFGFDGLAESTAWTTVAGVVWIIVMTGICYIGIEISAALQRWLLTIEVVMLVLLSVTALVKVYGEHPPPTAIEVDASWFNPFEVASSTAFTAGILAAVFIYWGWDTAVSVNEETADAARTPAAPPSSRPFCCCSSTRWCPPRPRPLRASAPRGSGSATRRTRGTCCPHWAAPSSAVPASAGS
ncbi:amino acid permease [Kitasatospora aburaviensis]